jgi:hypothetical protein
MEERETQCGHCTARVLSSRAMRAFIRFKIKKIINANPSLAEGGSVL